MNKKEFTSNIFSQKIAIVGDFFVDEYIYGHTTKIAREAPVIITKYDKTEKRIGGAGNAVRNAAAWGGTVIPIGFVGDDENGRFIINELENSGIRTSGIVIVEGRITPTKTRVMSGVKRGSYQQVLRMDKENDEPYLFKNQKELVVKFKSVLDLVHPDLILVSDYGLLTLTGEMAYEITSTKISEDYPIFLDSHGLEKFNKSRAIITNMEEAVNALKITEPVTQWEIGELCDMLVNKFNTQCVLLTRGKDGMVVFQKSNNKRETIYVPADNRFLSLDITGAGDTAAVIFARSLVASNDPFLSANIANVAAGISVSQLGASVADIQKTIENIDMNNDE